MAIQDEMYKMIEQEIELVVKEGREKVLVDKSEAESLVNQYMANIKNICK